MARAIISLSMKADKNGLRTEVRNMLRKAGWEDRGKARWEASRPSVAELLREVERATKILRREPSKPGEGTLDDLWIYVDNSV
jgi:hypothetical protein